MRFFNRAKDNLLFRAKNDIHSIQLEFHKIKDKGRETIQFTLPFSDSEFRERFTWQNFDRYVAFEELSEVGVVSSDNQMTVEDYYELLDSETVEVLKRIGLPTEVLPVTGDISIEGIPAKEPIFHLKLRNSKNQVLEQIADVTLPFIKVNQDVQYVVPKAIWLLAEAIEFTGYQSGYEKTAKIKKLAVEAGVVLDSFLEREEYEYIEDYEISPEMIDDTTLQLKIKSEDPLIENHLNSSALKSSVRSPGLKRTRYETSAAVREDIQVIKEKGPLKNDEIPMFFENPSSIFPEHTFQIDLEQFSSRVKGMIEIKRPRLMMSEGKWGWFDSESGTEIPINEEALKKVLDQHPDDLFVPYEKAWIYADKKLRDTINGDTTEKIEKPGVMVLDILDNEKSLEYQNEVNESVQYKHVPLPNGLQAELYEHQKEGFNWLCALYQNKRGGLLADDMGLGKTIQVLTFLLHLYEKNELGKTLVVLPIALIENWSDEIKKFAPSLEQFIYVHQGSKRLKKTALLNEKLIIFTSYDTLKIDQLIFGPIDFQSIITDEAQNIKSHASQRSFAIRALKAEFRLAMTGTPVENSLEELWAIMDFAHPGSLGSLSDFKKRYIRDENYEELMIKLKPFYLRRTKDEVLKDQLPTKHILPPRYVQASSIQQSLSSTMLSSVNNNSAHMLNVLTHLRQLYAHPGVFEPAQNEKDSSSVPKMKEVIDILNTAKKNQEKVLIFTEFRKVQSLLKQEISKTYGISVPVINGTTKERPEAVRQFNNSAGFGVMILSPKAAGVGLTITSANHVIHYTRWWNPAVENQATDRVYRIGQTKDVFVYQIITTDTKTFPEGTVEEIMDRMLAEKSDLAKNVIIPFDTKSLQREVLETFKAKM